MSAMRQSIDSSIPYGQTIARLNLGLDGELDALRSGRLIFGAFAGFGHAAQDFDGSDTSSESSNITAGAHARLNIDDFYGQAIVKFEHQNAHIDNAAADHAPFDVDLFGLSLATGIHLASPSLTLSPYARLTYLYASAGSFEDDSGSTIDLENAESLRGELALNLGRRLWQGATSGEASLDAGIRHEFSGSTEALVSGLSYSAALPGTLAVLAANLDLALLEERLTLRLNGEYAKGKKAEEFGANLSLNVNF
jgi:outer membrane autotransporter protein